MTLGVLWKVLFCFAHIHDIVVYVKEGLPYLCDSSFKNCDDSYLCFWLTLLHSVYFFLFSIDHLLLFAKWKVELKLFLQIRTRFSQVTPLLIFLEKYLITLITFLSVTILLRLLTSTRIPDFNAQGLVLLDLFVVSEPSLCFAVALSPIRNYDHVFVSAFLVFPVGSKVERFNSSHNLWLSSCSL